MRYLLLITFSAMLVSCSSTQNRESTGEYMDNSAISVKIKSKLVSDSLTSANSIEVESYKGTVILSGFVKTEREKEKALNLAKNTKGVKEVKDAIFIKNQVSL